MQDKAYLLFGTLTGPIPREDDPYLAFAEFLEGEWVGRSSLLLHRVMLIFSGEEFRELLDGPSGLRAVAIVRSPRLEPAPDGLPVIYLDVIASNLSSEFPGNMPAVRAARPGNLPGPSGQPVRVNRAARPGQRVTSPSHLA
jgi:hypothetical protein